MNNQATAVHNSQAIDNTPQEETMESAFQEHVDNHYPEMLESDLEYQVAKHSFYCGAQALLDAANPLSKIVVLQQEINDFLNPEGVDL